MPDFFPELDLNEGDSQEKKPAKDWYTHSPEPGAVRNGPYTIEQLFRLLVDGSVKKDDFAWCTGMADWTKIEEIPEFALFAGTPTAQGTKATTIEAPPLIEKPADKTSAAPTKTTLVSSEPEKEPTRFRGPPKKAEDIEPTHYTAIQITNLPSDAKQSKLKVTKFAPTSVITKEGVLAEGKAPSLSASEAAPKLASAFSSLRKLTPALLPLLALFSLGFVGFLSRDFIVLNVRLLEKRLLHRGAALPPLTAVSPADARALSAAATADLNIAGPKLQLAVSSDLLAPTVLYVASNLADGASFELRFSPDASTIAEPVKEIPPIEVRLTNHLAKTSPLLVPAGYYQVAIAPSAQQGNPAVVPWVEKISEGTSVRLFLGGSPDLSYETRLKDYQAVRSGNLKAELDSLLSIAEKLASILSDETRAADGFARLPNKPARQRAWAVFESNAKKSLDEVDRLFSDLSQTKLVKLKQAADEARKDLLAVHNANKVVADAETPAGGALSHSAVYSAQAAAEVASLTTVARNSTQALTKKIMDSEKALAASPATYVPE